MTLQLAIEKLVEESLQESITVKQRLLDDQDCQLKVTLVGRTLARALSSGNKILPRPGMLQRAAREHGVDLQASWMIGDSMTDIEAGDNAGCRTILIGSQAPNNAGSKPTLVADDLESAVQHILSLEMPATDFTHLKHNVRPQRVGEI